MKENKTLNILSLLILVVCVVTVAVIFPSCASNKPSNRLEIERLFMQTTKPEIGFIGNGDLDGGARTVSEDVSYKTSGIESGANGLGSTSVDTSKVYELTEIVLEVKSNFTSERDGRAAIDFKIMAPVDVLDPNWRLTLYPRVIDGDSICPLDTVIITGEGFKDKQDSDYEAYDDFLASIVDPSAYDSLYINWKTLDKEIVKVQKRNYNDYRDQYNMFMGYETWSKMNEMEFLDMESLAMRHKKHSYERSWRKAEKQILKNLKNGKDTVGIHDKYREKHKKDYVSFLKNKFSLTWLDSVNYDLNLHTQKDSVLKRSHIPRKYKQLHALKPKLTDIKAKPFTKDDSVKIAKHHYMIDEIVLNEMNINRKEDVLKETVEFPYRTDKYQIRVDTIITGENDIVYNYKQTWPVKPGMKNIKVVMDAKVEGIDRSVFMFPSTDTLTFVIATLSQLLDESLVTSSQKLYKSMFDKMVVYPTYKTAKTWKYDAASNGDLLDKVIEACNVYSGKPELQIDSITIRCTTDLRGEWGENYEMSQKRAESISDYLKSKVFVNTVIDPKGEDWSTLVQELRRRSSEMSNAEDIIIHLTSAVYPDQTEDDIKKKYPSDYKFIVKEIYPKLQRVEFLIDISRNDIEEDTVKETFREDYAEAIRLMKNRQYMEAIEILANYPDFNTALCLVCMGYNEKALEVLNQLPETAKNEYLSAIIYARKEDTRMASDCLIRACELDPGMYDRISLDSEVKSLADRLNLWPRLNQY